MFLSYDRILSGQDSTLKSKEKILVSSIVKNIDLVSAIAGKGVQLCIYSAASSKL